MDLATPLLCYGLAMGADAYSTQAALRNAQVHEGNPLMRSAVVMIASHAASAAALTYIDVRLQRRSRRAPWILRGAVVVGGTLAYHRNMSNARRR